MDGFERLIVIVIGIIVVCVTINNIVNKLDSINFTGGLRYADTISACAD